ASVLTPAVPAVSEAVVLLASGVGDEEVERRRVGDAAAVGGLLGRHTHEDAPHRHFHLLSGERVRDAGRLIDLVRRVPRRVVAAQRLADLRLECRVEGGAWCELYEQRHEETAIRKIEVDDERVLHFGQQRERTVDLRRADAYAVAVEGGVRATEHLAAAL